ncbi:MAG: protein kinase [Vulcanimicrobiota bacterium]
MFGFFRGSRRAEEPPLAPALMEWQELALELKGRYRLIQLAGRRGDQVYFEAVNPAGQKVRLSAWPTCADVRHEVAAGWRNQLAVYPQLRHQSLNPILDCGSSADWLWWVSPQPPGQPLDSWLRGARPGPSLIRIWLGQLLAVLDYLHQLGVIHRSLEPANILVQGQRLWLAELSCRYIPYHAQVGPCAIPRYLTPEEIQGTALSPATNYFSLGCILYEMVSGEPAFAGDDVMQVLVQILQPGTPDCSKLPEPYSDLVPRLLERKPEQRLCDSRELLHPGQPLASTGEATSCLVEDLAAQGYRVSQNQSFTLSPVQAIEKLRTFRFPDPWDWLEALCAAAGGLRAQSLTVSWKKGRLSLHYAGVQLRPEQLENLWLSAYQNQARGLSWLALGLASGLYQHEGAKVRLCCAGRKLNTGAVGPVRLQRALAGPLNVSIGPVAEPDWLSVRSRFKYASFPINWNGLQQASTLPNQPDLPEGLQVRLDLFEKDQALAIVDGLSFPLTLSGLIGRVLIWGEFGLDAHRRNLLDSRLEQLPGWLEPLVQAEVERFSLRPRLKDPQADLVYARFVNGLTEDDPRLTRFYEDYLGLVDEEAAETPLSDFFWDQCWKFWLSQSQRPRRFYELARRRRFLNRSRLTWAGLREIGRHAFPTQKGKAALWLLQAWLEWEIQARPTAWELREFWVDLTASRLEEVYDARLSRQLKGGLAEGWSDGQKEVVARLLPSHWVRSRTLLAPSAKQIE